MTKQLYIVARDLANLHSFVALQGLDSRRIQLLRSPEQLRGTRGLCVLLLPRHAQYPRWQAIRSALAEVGAHIATVRSLHDPKELRQALLLQVTRTPRGPDGLWAGFWTVDAVWTRAEVDALFLPRTHPYDLNEGTPNDLDLPLDQWNAKVDALVAEMEGHG